MKLSVCIPAYNAADRMAATLEHLVAAISKLPRGVCAEVIVVDNNSADGSALLKVCEEVGAGAMIDVRVVQQPIPGAAFARAEGCRVATGDIIVFCDDDVSVGVDSLVFVSQIASLEPQVVGGGGSIEGKLPTGVDWPVWFDDRIKSNLAINAAHARQTYGGRSPPTYLPVSAFVWYRRSALNRWSEMIESQSFKPLGPSGAGMWRGDDQEMALIVLAGGGELKLDPRIVVQHRISADRITPTYMQTLLYWNGRSKVRYEHRWVDGRWLNLAWWFARYFALRRPLLCWRYFRERRLELAIRSGWTASATDQQRNAAMHRAFFVGELDEMLQKLVSPSRF